jgi:cytochrome c peroxidase
MTLHRILRMMNAKKWAVTLAVLTFAGAVSATIIPNLLAYADPTGAVSTNNTHGAINENNPFFESLGTNGRSCGTCHAGDSAFGLSTADINERFTATNGNDPLFALVDGANCPSGSQTDASNHTLLLQNGLIRIPLVVPATAQFQITAVYDPYGCAIVTNPDTGQQTVSVYRRPLPTANLGFLSTVMFDGRETLQPLNNKATFQPNLTTDLTQQAIDATLNHAQALNPPTAAQLTSILNFELGLSSAQMTDSAAGPLTAAGAQGGARILTKTTSTYYPGINDSLGGDPDGVAFNPVAFTLFDSWSNLKSGTNPAVEAARASIARGQAIFNSQPLIITSVRGLNDNATLGSPPSITGTCTTCHDTPNVGDHSFPLALDIGTGHDVTSETDPFIAAGLSQLTMANVPVYEITGCTNPFPGSDSSEPYIVYTTDPGKALISGQCSDLIRTKGPVLRGLAARAPYFHNGAAQNLTELVNFYNLRFQMNLSDQQMTDLIAFLNSL